MELKIATPVCTKQGEGVTQDVRSETIVVKNVGSGTFTLMWGRIFLWNYFVFPIQNGFVSKY